MSRREWSLNDGDADVDEHDDSFADREDDSDRSGVESDSEYYARARYLANSQADTPRPADPLTDPMALLNSLGIVGPNIIHAEQGMHPDGKHSADDTWDGPGWCVCGREWPCEAQRLGEIVATLDATRAPRSLSRWRRQNVEEGGGMVADPQGQWVHVETLGVQSWVLDALDDEPATLDAAREYAARATPAAPPTEETP